MTGYLHADVPAAFHAQACFQRIFQKIGEHQAHVDFIHRNPGGQVDLCGKRNLSPPGKRTVVAYHAVCSLIFTKRNGEVRNFTRGTGEYVLIFRCRPVRPERTTEENDGVYHAAPAWFPRWRCGGCRTASAAAGENDSPAAAWRFGSGCLP